MEKKLQYVAGVDGGGTKTACIVCDSLGNLLGYALTEGSNHQITGLAATVGNVLAAVDEACAQAGIGRGQLATIFIGIAGADLAEDFSLLNTGFSAALADIPFQIVNDVWIAHASGTGEDWGAVMVCGTGANMAVKRRDGKAFTVRALRYQLGNYGGGIHLAEMALHYAFRCEEHTGRDTRLARELPAFCGCETMAELALRIYQSGYSYHRDYSIAKLVFQLAHEGDAVSLGIIRHMGRDMGDMLANLICHAGLAGERVPVVLSGGQFAKDEHRLLVTPLCESLCEKVPKANPVVVYAPPAAGAALRALRTVGAGLDADARAAFLQAAIGQEPLFLPLSESAYRRREGKDI